jgi:hypothetical protein
LCRVTDSPPTDLLKDLTDESTLIMSEAKARFIALSYREEESLCSPP